MTHNSESPQQSQQSTLMTLPDTAAFKWDGIEPSPHDAGGRPINKCNFCEKNDVKTTIVGHPYTGGVLFVCPPCKKGLTYRLTEIMGKHLWKLVDCGEQIMVPRSKGPNEMWFCGSRLPTIHSGEWHLHVRSLENTIDPTCLSKVVPVQILQELNKA